MKDKLAEMFAALTAASKFDDQKDKVELCAIRNGQQEIIIPFRDDADFIKKIKRLNINREIPTEIMISYLSSTVFNFINKNFKLPKIVATRDELESDYYFKNKRLIDKIQEYSEAVIFKEAYKTFLYKNELFSQFINSHFSTSRISTVINEMLNKYNVLSFDEKENEFKYTELGAYLFSTDLIYNRAITVLTYSDNLRFINEKSFDIPLVKWKDDVANYIFDNISTVQIRGGILSFQGKTFDLKTIQNVLLYCAVNHDFSTREHIEIKINPISLRFSFTQKQGENKIKNFLRNFEDLVPVNQNVFNLPEDIHVFKRKKGNRTSIELISYGKNEDYNPVLDDIDYKILDYAGQVNSFTRNDIEKLLNGYISSRTIIYSLNNLTRLGYLKRTGGGRSFKYSLR